MPDDPHSDDETVIDADASRDSDSKNATRTFEAKSDASARSIGQPLQAGEMFGRYEILECLDRGGMGVVYRARHTALGKQVALKVVSTMMQSDPAAMNRFLREMQAIGCLESHPHVLAAYDAGNESGVQYIATELIDGMHLRDLVTRTGPLLVAEACRIVSQAASALEHLRKHQLVHRDVKPNNLMLTRDGEVKLVDMGLALLREEQSERLTLAGEAMGSIDYIAPEQWLDSHEVDWRSDVYSLGCTFYYLLAGRAPFYQKNRGSFSRMQAHLTSEFPDICKIRQDVPKSASKLLLSLVAKSPNDRFTDLNVIAEQANMIASGDLKGLVSRGFTTPPRSLETDFSPAPVTPSREPAGEQVAARWPQSSVELEQETISTIKPPVAYESEPKRFLTRIRVGLIAVLIGMLGLIAVWITLNKDPATEPIGVADMSMAVDITGKSSPKVIAEPTASSVISCVGHSSKVMGLTFIGDQRLGSVSEKGVLCLFDLSDPTTPSHTVQVSERALSSILFRAEQQTLLIACEDGTLQLRSSEDGSEIHIEYGTGGLTDAIMIPNSNFAAVTLWNGNVRLTDVSSTPWETRLISTLDEAIFDIDVTPDARKLVWAGRKPTIDIFDLENEETTEIAGHQKWVFAIAVSEDNQHIASGGHDSLVQIASLTTGQAVSTFRSVVPQAIQFLPDSIHLAVAGRGGTVEIWDWKQENKVAAFEATQPIDCIAVSPNGKRIAAGTVDGRVLVWPLSWTSTSPQDAL